MKNTDCLSLLRLLPPGINPLLIIRFVPPFRIEVRNNVTAGFRCGLAFATSFPVTLFFTLSIEMVSDFAVAYLLTIRTQETVLSRNKDAIMRTLSIRITSDVSVTYF